LSGAALVGLPLAAPQKYREVPQLNLGKFNSKYCRASIGLFT
jgi:hypothetical protein